MLQSELMAEPGLQRTTFSRFFVVCGACFAVLLGCELIARAYTQPIGVSGRPPGRADNVEEFSRHPSIAPRRTGDPELWLLGNSHTYSLPGRHRGDPLLEDPGVTLIDQIATRTEQTLPRGSKAFFLRLSYPNFLPVEMLLRLAYALEHGPAPRVVVIGLSYRNIALDNSIREDIRSALREGEFAASARRTLARADLGASPALRALIHAEITRASHQADADGARAHADTWDERLMDFLGQHIRLIGRNTQLRGYMLRRFSYAVDSLMTHADAEVRRVPPVVSERAINLSALHVLVRLLRERGTEVLAYGVPQRSDAPPIVDTAEEASTFAGIERDFNEVGAHYIDLSHVVPNQHWGWEADTVDRSHFAQPGHALLGAAIVREAVRLHLLDALTRR